MNRTANQNAEPNKKRFEDAARPLVQWLAENCHPHTTAVVTSTNAELLVSVEGFETAEYLKD